MKAINRIKVLVVNLIINYPHYLINSLIYMFSRKNIQISAWVEIRYGNVRKRNWGDDINIFLLQQISGRKIIVRNQSLFHRFSKKINYICIGSILGLYENQNSIIWGAGFIEGNQCLLSKPLKICSVRGKMTRDLLLKAGYDCPPVYGDPALLISKFYTPLIKEKSTFRIGFILHYVDEGNQLIKEIVENNDDCIKISLTDYDKWTDVIDKICSCELIISSSLHGLIVSDTYGIPNVWARFSNRIVGGYFKYLDYFSSVGRIDIEPEIITSMNDITELYEKRVCYRRPEINLDEILRSCPFHISKIL